MKPAAYVFTGPTLAGSGLRPPAGMAFLPPAAQGDVCRAARERPVAIGIVDGYFEGQASVWHREILWAMDLGIHVFGSASMGALRAAELHPFGMVGVGRIFAAYRDGVLEDDDEVAVLHGPAEAGYLPLSEPMANIRATLDEAGRQRVIDRSLAAALIDLAKRTFYQERRWQTLLSEAGRIAAADAAIGALRAWLPSGRVDQKAADARAMLEAMTALLQAPAAPPAVSYHFEWTEMWDEVHRRAAADPPPSQGDEPAAGAEAVLDELRLDGRSFDTTRRLALLRHLAARGGGERPAPGGRELATAFRARHGLFTQAAFERWLADQHLDRRRFDLLIKEEADLEALLSDLGPSLDRPTLDQLRIDGSYRRLAERAQAKQQDLEQNGQTEPAVDDVPLTPWQLRAWYFEMRRREPVPDDLDAVIRTLGFADRQAFDRALRREYLYVTRNED